MNYGAIMKNLKQELKKYRKAAGLTQVELAKLSGIKQWMIANYETRAKDIPASIYFSLISICKRKIKKNQRLIK
jgi:predicted transcriptional regulator